MILVSSIDATGAPPITLEAMRRDRILARVDLSPALASAVAEIAFGISRRDHGALLVDLTACRTAAAGVPR